MAITLLFSFTPTLATEHVTTSIDRYHSVIEQARQGHYEDALAYLDEKITQNPFDTLAKRDLIVVRSWAGLHHSALTLYENRGLNVRNSDPDYVKQAAATSYLETQQPKAVLALIADTTRLTGQAPSSTEWQVLTLRALIQTGDSSTLRRQRDQLLLKATTARELAALSEIFMQAGLGHDALSAASLAVQREPQSVQWKQHYITALHHSGSPRQALDYATQHQISLNPEQLATLETDANAELTRQSLLHARQTDERYAVAEQAIARYDALLEKWQPKLDANHPIVQRLTLDKMLALNAAARPADVISEYERLIAMDASVPDYVLDAVSSSYLSLQEPEQAAAIYQRHDTSHALSPEAIWIRRLNQNYVYQESGVFAQADNVLDEALRDTSKWVSVKGAVEADPNPRYLDIQTTIALRQYYANNLPQARETAKELLTQAPGNSRLRVHYANTLRANGLPRKAEQQLKIVETTEPVDRALLLSQGYNALALNEWEQARSLDDYLMTHHPETNDVQRFHRRWETHQLNELVISTGTALDSGNTADGDNGIWFNSKLYTQPVTDEWRPFVGYQLNHAKYDNRSISFHTGLAGMQWRSRNNQAEIEVNTQNYRDKNRVGARVWWEHTFSDHWKGGVQLAARSTQTPLRALSHGVHSNRADFYIQWQASALSPWRLRYSPSRFTDGNQRNEVFLTGQTRLLTRDRYLIDGMLEASTSRNSLGNTQTQDRTPYFNPKSDFFLLPKLGFEQLLHQHYERRWSHRLELGVGTYHQQSYGSGSVLSASYKHHLAVNDRFFTSLGVSAMRRPYDGIKENNLNVILELNWRF